MQKTVLTIIKNDVECFEFIYFLQTADARRLLIPRTLYALGLLQMSLLMRYHEPKCVAYIHFEPRPKFHRHARFVPINRLRTG